MMLFSNVLFVEIMLIFNDKYPKQGNLKINFNRTNSIIVIIDFI